MNQPSQDCKTTSTTLIVTAPPFGKIDGKEAVDLALVCAAFDQQVNLIFVEQGIFHLVKEQNAAFFDDKLHDKQLSALSFYDIDTLFVETESLQRFGLTSNMLIDNVSTITRTEINQLISQSDNTVKF